MSGPKWKHRPCPCGCGELADECGSGGGLNAFQIREPIRLPLHRTEAGWPRCSTCDGGGCLDCTDPA